MDELDGFAEVRKSGGAGEADPEVGMVTGEDGEVSVGAEGFDLFEGTGIQRGFEAGKCGGGLGDPVGEKWRVFDPRVVDGVGRSGLNGKDKLNAPMASEGSQRIGVLLVRRWGASFVEGLSRLHEETFGRAKDGARAWDIGGKDFEASGFSTEHF